MGRRRATIGAKRLKSPSLLGQRFPTHRRLKRRNVVNFRRRFRRNLNAYQAGHISFAELDASVQGWINHVRYANTWGLRRTILAQPIAH